jgi:CheY-like chemotaxis protein
LFDFAVLTLSPAVTDFSQDHCCSSSGRTQVLRQRLILLTAEVTVFVCPDSNALEDAQSMSPYSNEGGLPSRPTRVLIVEDERHIARLLEFILRKAGYELTICYSAEQALQEIQKSEPDALVLDLFLPGMTGIEFLRAIRSAPYSCTCVVVTLSSHSLDQLDTALTEAGATAQCSKPIAPSTLLKKLQQLGVHQSSPLEA